MNLCLRRAEVKIWQIKDRPKSLILTDEQLIIAIKNGLLNGDDVLINVDLKDDIAIKDSIYSFYLKDPHEQD